MSDLKESSSSQPRARRVTCHACGFSSGEYERFHVEFDGLCLECWKEKYGAHGVEPAKSSEDSVPTERDLAQMQAKIRDHLGWG